MSNTLTVENKAPAADTHQVPPPVVLLNILSGMMSARALQVAARFDIADQLKNGPVSVTDLAAVTNTNPTALYRLLRALASLGIFQETGEGVFAQTDLSHFLRSDVPGSMRNMARMWGEDWRWETWGEMAYSIQNARPAFDHIYGKNLWHYFGEDNSAAGRLFSLAMTAFSESVNHPVVEAYDFSTFKRVADIGGAHGSLLKAILETNPALEGILFDLPPVVESAREPLREAGLADRVELSGGDFFQNIPTGADAYLLKFIIHDWADLECIQILKNSRKVMQPDSRLLIIEQIVPEGNEPSFSKILDLEMLVVLTGKERTEAEFRSLLAETGFKLARIVPTHSPFSIIEAIPA